ncbi:aldose epimerase family protein [Paracoccus sp. 2205BS29-5]|uniref:Aldose 1-epimerase n=1 Tax=Paracoccus spongiarum TaxID=3064387 RepID=A0ABT9J7S6_9RHOB|nr:aldose epimerase family protein [Paracoccus sp. 2205BS29-5]MDP5305860.1 aldose epimerase family protein [Paracoccus sp. 2205BS29-5]
MARPCGSLPDGRQVQRVTLRGGRLTARVLTLGAIVQDLRLDGVGHPLVLGCPEPADYLAGGRYLGAIVGRFANRIGGARFRLDGRDHATDANFRARHTLHGGAEGCDLMLWHVEALASDRVSLRLELPDGHMGFPGRLRIGAQISLADDALGLTLLAQTDAPTPCSLAHHGYFDLDGSGDARDHRLQVMADGYLPVDDDLIPTGEIAPVAGGRFDFRAGRGIGDGGYDHNFCLSDAPQALRPVARLTGRDGLSMTVETTACGLQLYDGAHLSGVAGQDGRSHGAHAGIALETQHWPDAPNRPNFPDAILRPGRIYAETTRYRFSA